MGAYMLFMVLASAICLTGQVEAISPVKSANALNRGQFDSTFGVFLQTDVKKQKAGTDDGRCKNDCSYNGYCMLGECLCRSGFTGEDCSQSICLNDCNGNGICENGVCMCLGDHEGPDCSYRGCPLDCNGHGVCHITPTETTCVCFGGYAGDACDLAPPEDVGGCPNDCSGVGVCQDGKCYCNEPFTGLDCSQMACKDNCNERGVCELSSGHCNCDEGYYGNYCENVYCPGVDGPMGECSGHGTCDSDLGVCSCDSNFFGDDCAPGRCPNDCSGHGKCKVALDSGVAQCICTDGYVGVSCETKVCPKGWAGENCEIRQCVDGCNGHGKCNKGTWECECHEGWEGKTCAIAGCPHNCNDHGICNNGKCECLGDWSGEYCGVKTVACPNDCMERGMCSEGVCYCADGYAGDDCSIVEDPNSYAEGVVSEESNPLEVSACEPPCASTGTCITKEDGVSQCFCQKGYAGSDCSKNIEETTVSLLEKRASAKNKKRDQKALDPVSL